MATYFARASGNINGAIWATTPSGTAGSVTFAIGDVLLANSFSVTVNVNTNLGATGEVRNDTAGGATAGGSFTLSNGVTLTSNVIAGSTSTACVTFGGTTSASITGNCTGGSATNAYGVSNTGSGTLNITGICTGGTGNSAFGVLNNTGTVNISGNCIGGSSNNTTYGANNTGIGNMNITGTCTGGNTSPGAFNGSTGTLLINGTIQASEFVAGVGGSNRAQVTLLTGPFLISTTFGVNPIACVAWRWASALNNQTYLEVGTQTLLQKRNLVTPDNATNFPAQSNVRSAITFGIGGALTGTLVVPAAHSVAFGVPVDNTTGTAVLTPSAVADAVWDALLTDHTTNNTFGARVVRSLNSNNELQITGSHHAAADVHEFQPQVITDDAFAPSTITMFMDATRAEFAGEITELEEVHLIHGLKSGSAMTVTPTSRVAGAVSQTISGDGSTTTTVTRD